MGNCLGEPRGADQLVLSEEGGIPVAIGQNQPLLQEPVVWTSEMPLTEGQLRGKRDTFWETAPAYEGRKEIWDALRAAVEAAEQEDYDLAQAILNGASISLPTGQLTEAYDELGNRYIIPKYCLSKPTNVQGSATTGYNPLPSHGCKRQEDGHKAGGIPMTMKVRLSTIRKDLKVTVLTTDRVRDLKKKLEADHGVDSKKITLLYSGRVLNNSTLIKDLDIPKGFVIQAVVT